MQKLFRGGTIANTLNDVPDAIDKMLKENYKKIADINCDIRLESQKEIKIPLNLEFKPSKVLFLIQAEDSQNEFLQTWVNTDDAKNEKNNKFSIHTYYWNMSGYFMKEAILSKEEMILQLRITIQTNGAFVKSYKIVRCIAIE